MYRETEIVHHLLSSHSDPLASLFILLLIWPSDNEAVKINEPQDFFRHYQESQRKLKENGLLFNVEKMNKSVKLARLGTLLVLPFSTAF